MMKRDREVCDHCLKVWHNDEMEGWWDACRDMVFDYSNGAKYSRKFLKKELGVKLFNKLSKDQKEFMLLMPVWDKCKFMFEQIAKQEKDGETWEAWWEKKKKEWKNENSQ